MTATGKSGSATANLPAIEIFKLDPRVITPTRANDAAGWDIHAFILTESGRPSKKMVSEKNTIRIPTGLVLRPPAGYYLQICSRSGLASSSVFVANAPGIIDPDYTGELQVLLFNGGYKYHMVEHGHRIAQVVMAPLVPTMLREVAKAPQSSGRGAAGFGSTGL